MPYQATVLKIMIASPSDVSIERGIIRETLYEWNAVNSDMRKIVLLPVAWETHSSPEMGEPPQKIINKRLLKDCDLLVGVFWTRVGTATGDYASGTVEEIEEHVKSGKPTMIYFSSVPVHPDSIDQEQYSKLLAFKDSCKSRGLYEIYFDLSDFRSKFNRQLQILLNANHFIKLSGEVSIPELSTKIIVPNMPNLSHEAQILLKEASQDKSGIIMRLEYIGGFTVQSNDKDFVGGDNNPRTHAIWEGAIEELEKFGLIKDKGYKREVFAITKTGFDLAELITL